MSGVSLLSCYILMNPRALKYPPDASTFGKDLKPALGQLTVFPVVKYRVVHYPFLYLQHLTVFLPKAFSAMLLPSHRTRCPIF